MLCLHCPDCLKTLLSDNRASVCSWSIFELEFLYGAVKYHTSWILLPDFRAVFSFPEVGHIGTLRVECCVVCGLRMPPVLLRRPDVADCGLFSVL